MKKISLLCALVFFANTIVVAQTPTPVKSQKSTVAKVVIFQQGAQLFYNENVTIGAGTTQIAFENVSPYVLQHTLQASASAASVVVLDVRYNVKVVEATDDVDKTLPDEAIQRYAREIKAAQDSMVDSDFNQKEITFKTNAIQAERNLLANNKMMRGDTRDSMALFVQVIDFYKQRIGKMDEESLKLEREQYKLNLIRTKLNERMRNLQMLMAGKEPKPKDQPKPTPQVIVTLLSDYATTTSVEFNYAIQQAGWTAGYDLRASKETPSIDLKHRAQVYQNSGVNWQNVSLVLSTGDPNQSNAKPVLQPQYLTQAPPPVAYGRVAVTGATAPLSMSRAPAAANNNRNYAEEKDESLSDVMEKKKLNYDLGTVSQNLTRVEYEIKVKYSIESDGKPRNVVIQSRNVPATYVYSVVPKLDGVAFLIAKVTGWEDMNLVAGTARIYFDNSFIGESTINPSNLSDTLSLNLGRDKGIVVTRTKIKDKSKDKFIGDDRVLTREFEIAVRSTKNNNIRIVIEDQMPVSNDAAIKITPVENDDARYNTETGKLIWDINLRSRDTKRIRFSYEVKYNKDRAVYGL